MLGDNYNNHNTTIIYAVKPANLIVSIIETMRNQEERTKEKWETKTGQDNCREPDKVIDI